MLSKNTPITPPGSAGGLLTWAVGYVAEFPTGQPVTYELHYQAPVARTAVELWRAEMRRAELKNPLGFSYHFAGVVPLGAAND
jgi:hypothetical protein